MNRDDFIEAFYYVLEQAIIFSQKARREGLLALEKMLDHEKINNRDIFDYGMQFAIDGTDYDIIREIVLRVINQEKDENLHLLKQIQLEAILSILVGDNPRIIAIKLNSFTDIPLIDLRYRKLLGDYSLL